MVDVEGEHVDTREDCNVRAVECFKDWLDLSGPPIDVGCGGSTSHHSIGLVDRSVPQGDGSCRIGSEVARVGMHNARPCEVGTSQIPRVVELVDSSWVPRESSWKSHRCQSPGVDLHEASTTDARVSLLETVFVLLTIQFGRRSCS